MLRSRQAEETRQNEVSNKNCMHWNRDERHTTNNRHTDTPPHNKGVQTDSEGEQNTDSERDK